MAFLVKIDKSRGLCIDTYPVEGERLVDRADRRKQLKRCARRGFWKREGSNRGRGASVLISKIPVWWGPKSITGTCPENKKRMPGDIG